MKRIPRRQAQRDQARSFLLHQLHDGPRTVEAIRYEAHRSGLAWRTVRRARAGIAVSIRRGGLAEAGFWIWVPSATKEAIGEGKEANICPVCGQKFPREGSAGA